MEYSRPRGRHRVADLKTQYVPVAIGEGKHPAPFRTRKLSPLPPMVLLWRRSGRVGRRRGTVETGVGRKPAPVPFVLSLPPERWQTPPTPTQEPRSLAAWSGN